LVAIPLMVSLFGLGQHLAHGTSLVMVVFSGLLGASSYARSGDVDVQAALLITLTAIPMARIGATQAHRLPEWKLKRSFGAFMVVMSTLLLAKPFLPTVSLVSVPVVRWLLLLSTGAVTGFLSGMMGVGGGTIIVPVMVLVMGVGQHVAQGTSLLTMAPASASGAFTHWQARNIAVRLLPGMILGVLAGVSCTGRLAHQVPETLLRSAFILTMVYLAMKYLRTRAPVETRSASLTEPPNSGLTLRFEGALGAASQP
jgi:uncharacterized membrane protein YfcA